MSIFMTVWWAMIGACLGSFSSVLIYRLYKDDTNVVFGRSKCCKTGKTLTWWELVPIFSWLFLRGRSRHTGERIPVFYFILEVVFAAVFGWFGAKFSADFSWETLQGFLPLALLLFFSLVLFFYDAKYMLVDRRISWPAIGVALIWALFQEKSADFLIGGGIGFAFYWLQYTISRGKWVGGGDQELALFMGLVLGWKNLLLALFLAYLIGMIFSFGLIAVQKNTTLKSAVPMGAFLMPALILFLYNADWWWSLYDLAFAW